METIKNKRIDSTFLGSSDFYRLLYANSKDAIMVLTPEDGFLAGNQAAIELFGCQDEADFISRTPASLSPQYQPDGRLSTEKSLEMMEIAKKSGSNYFEWLHAKANGDTFPAIVFLSWWEADGFGILQATVRDVTKLKEYEKNFLEANEYLNNLLDFAVAPTVVWNSDMVVTRFNRSFERLTGRKAEDVVGKSIEGLFLPGLVEGPIELIKKSLYETIEIKVSHINGSTRDVLWDSATISVAGNESMASTITQGRDISEYKKLEKTLRAKIDDLESVNQVINKQLEALKNKIV